jgi:hypothetical protein
VISAGPFEHDHPVSVASHVHPRYETPTESAHAMYWSMNPSAQSFSPSSPVTTGTLAATGAMVALQLDAVASSEKL